MDFAVVVSATFGDNMFVDSFHILFSELQAMRIDSILPSEESHLCSADNVLSKLEAHTCIIINRKQEFWCRQKMCRPVEVENGVFQILATELVC